jgi:hypothetical protein
MNFWYCPCVTYLCDEMLLILLEISECFVCDKQMVSIKGLKQVQPQLLAGFHFKVWVVSCFDAFMQCRVFQKIDERFQTWCVILQVKDVNHKDVGVHVDLSDYWIYSYNWWGCRCSICAKNNCAICAKCREHIPDPHEIFVQMLKYKSEGH